MPVEGAIKAILFDLDGTLVDTAPDLATALNFVLKAENHEPLPYHTIRPAVSFGADGLLKLGFGGNLDDIKNAEIKAKLIAFYKENIAVKSKLFEGMDAILKKLESHGIAWGVVTNKPQHLTEPLLEKLALNNRLSCVVSGDQVDYAKPNPESLILACQLLNVSPDSCIYVGDAQRDIQAGQRAGCKTVACEYGYIPFNEDINTWGADEIVTSPVKLYTYLEQII